MVQRGDEIETLSSSQFIPRKVLVLIFKEVEWVAELVWTPKVRREIFTLPLPGNLARIQDYQNFVQV